MVIYLWNEKIPKEPGLKFQNSWLKIFLQFFFIEIEIADELKVIKIPKLVQTSSDIYSAYKVWRHPVSFPGLNAPKICSHFFQAKPRK